MQGVDRPATSGNTGQSATPLRAAMGSTARGGDWGTEDFSKVKQGGAVGRRRWGVAVQGITVQKAKKRSAIEIALQQVAEAAEG